MGFLCAKTKFLGVFIHFVLPSASASSRQLPPASAAYFLVGFASARNRPSGGGKLFIEALVGFLRKNEISRCIYPLCASVGFRQLP